MAIEKISPSGRPTRPGEVVQAARWIIFGFLALDIAIEMALRAGGLLRSLNSVVPLEDPFADYFRFVTSYPGGDQVRSAISWLDAQLRSYHAVALPTGAAALATGRPTHFNAPPITTLFGLVNVPFLRSVEPMLPLSLMFLALLCYWAAIVRRFVPDRAESADWMVIFLGSYPMLMMVVRGNIYAGLTGLLIVHALLLRGRERAPTLCALMMAVAIGIRPNAIAFLVPLIALRGSDRAALMIRMAVAVPVVSGIALVLAHAIYPDYTIATFLAGVRGYHASQAGGGWGIGYGSSLFGALALLFGRFPFIEMAATACAGMVGIGAIMLHRHGRIGDPSYLFLICAAYCLGSTIIADYHLLVFLLPVLVAAQAAHAGQLNAGDRIALIASCLMLAPKNYPLHGGLTIQPIVNPLLLLGASLLVAIFASRRSSRHAPISPFGVRGELPA